MIAGDAPVSSTPISSQLWNVAAAVAVAAHDEDGLLMRRRARPFNDDDDIRDIVEIVMRAWRNL